MIKLGRRHNLIYPIIFIIFNGLRKIDSIIMKDLIEFYGSLLLTMIIFFADFLSGLIIYLNHLKFLKQKEATKFMGIELIQAPSEIQAPDSKFKIYLLLFLAIFIDFAEYVLSSCYIPMTYKKASISLEWRLKSIIICASALFSYYILKFPIFKHQVLCIIITFFCLLVVVITEIIAYYIDKKESRYFFLLFLFFIDHIFSSGLDIIEKYLLEYDFINPFKMLMIEGLIGLILCLLFSILQDPFEGIKEIKPERIPYLIIAFIFYFFFSWGRNLYRVITNKLYSPMTRALADYILVPILIIFYYVWEGDFTINGQKIFIYFFINCIISIIVVGCGLVYNEFIILFCCDLAYDTHYEVSKRATIIDLENNDFHLNEVIDDSTFNEDN